MLNPCSSLAVSVLRQLIRMGTQLRGRLHAENRSFGTACMIRIVFQIEKGPACASRHEDLGSGASKNKRSTSSCYNRNTATMTVLASSPTSFSSAKFLEDLKRTSDAVGAPYSEPAILAVLKVFEECFKESVVIWRTSDRPDDPLNYRFYLRRRLDTISIATEAGLLKSDDPIARQLTSWSSLYDGESWQWCDFDPKAGLAKTWVNLRGRRPLDDILNAPEVPVSVRNHGPTFHQLGLETVIFVAGDYHGNSINLYFAAPGPLSSTQAAQYANLADCSPPTDREFDDMHNFLSPQSFTFAVTMDYKTGRITRVAFYALRLTPGRSPTVGDRISKFFTEAPSYDQEQTRMVAWSYGLGDSKYIKAESSYVGEWASLLRASAPPSSA